MEKKEKQGVNW